jgi:hypothetical protein
LKKSKGERREERGERREERGERREERGERREERGERRGERREERRGVSSEHVIQNNFLVTYNFIARFDSVDQIMK